jgi:UDP-GlcNAc:undecaprenyl-phosphate GlcNAc-1-phosphate transferase
MRLIFVLITALFISLIVTFFTREFAIKHKFGVFPDQRKVHKSFMPHMGGIGIFSGFISGLLLAIFIIPEFSDILLEEYFGILIASVLIFIVGLVDDIKGLTPGIKFTGQFVAVTIIVLSGFIITIVDNPIGGMINLGILSIPITYLWVIGVNNAVNLLDGLDGLAAGVSIIAGIVFLISGMQNNDPATIILTIALIGSLLGFLRFNSHPASIFMGDTGSLFLGFIVAILGIKAFESADYSVKLIIPMIALAIPIGDTSVAFFRRLNQGKHPFKPDKDHLHHRLIYLGLSHRQTVYIIYFVSILYAISAYLILTQSTFFGVVIFSITAIISFVGLKRIGYLEAQRIKTYYGDDEIIRVNQAMAPLFMQRLIHKILLSVSDIIMINLALLITWWFRFKSGFVNVERPVDLTIAMDLPVIFIVTLSWIGLFILNNLYNMRWDVSRFDQIRRVGKVILFGLLLIFIITMDPTDIFSEGRLAILIYGMTIFITVNLGRMVIINVEKWFAVLEYGKHHTLLVGDTEKARKLLKDIRSNPHLLYELVGYLSKEKKEKPFYELPNLGTYNAIADIIRIKGIEEVIIAINERSRDEILNIVALAENTGVIFKIIPQFYDVVSGHKTEEMIGHPLIRLFPESMYLWQWGAKRLFDIIISIILIVPLIPIAFVINILQALSGIYPFYSLTPTVGKFGKLFKMLNLNYVSRKKGSKSFVGKFLYMSRIYKLPSVVNIFFGKMSFVGPRPQDVDTVNMLRGKIKFYNRRFQVRPGLTGWSQVKYRYEDALKHQREQLKQDLFYLENISLTFDFRILLRSIFIFLFRR